jgi:hypothetical protein
MTLSSDFAISRRQAYRYVRQARTLDAPLRVAEPVIPVTVKLPGDVARRLRAHAASSGLTQGEIVGRALEAYIGQARDRA